MHPVHMSSVFKKGADQIKKALGTNFDPELAFYDQLTEADFYHLEEGYGPDVLQSYIQHMELKRSMK